MSAPRVYGLVLTGGLSRRMGTDKAELAYGGIPQIARLFDLLEPVCDRVFISCRRDQATSPARAGRPQIHDLRPDGGALAGLEAAFAAHPGVAWLVVACDLPGVDAATRDRLLAGRDPHRAATAFRGWQDLPEPLFALWEPRAAAAVTAGLTAGLTCPRKVLLGTDVTVLEAVGDRLANANTPDEARAWGATLRENLG